MAKSEMDSAPATQNRAQQTLIFDEPYPWWLRIFTWPGAIFFFWLGLGSIAHVFFGTQRVMGMDFSSGTDFGRSAWFVIPALFGLGALWLIPCCGRMQLFYDGPRRELLTRTRLYRRFNERRVSLDGCREIRLLESRGGRKSVPLLVRLEFSDGRQVDWLHLGSRGKWLEERLLPAVGLPVTLHEDAGRR